MSYELKKHKFLSDPEQEHLESQLNHFMQTHPRDVTVIHTLLHTGARPSELLLTKVSDLNREDKTIYLKGLKGSRDREIPLPDWLWRMLQAQVFSRGPDEPVFNMALRTLQTVWSQYRPVKKGVRCLRHTFAMKLYLKTKDIRLVQLALGHKSINNTMVYADFVYNQEQFRRLLL